MQLFSLVNYIRKWQAEGLEKQYGTEPVALFYAKTLSNVLVSCSIVLALFTIGFLFIDPARVAIEQKFLNTAINGVLIAVYGFAFIKVRHGFYELARNVFIAISVSMIVFSIMITGGFVESSVSSAIIVIPILVYLFYGLKAGTIIAVIAPVVLAAQYGLSYYLGFQFPNLAVQNDPFIQSVVPPMVVYVLLLCIVAGYEYRQAILQTELKCEREKLAKLSEQDPLTEVANSRVLQKELSAAVQSSRAQDQNLAMLFLDLDGFKKINDTHGHAIGDAVLKVVARRLLDCARHTDLVARVGGDEFAILMRGDLSRDNLQAVHQRLSAMLAIPIHHEGIVCRVGASIGIASYPQEVASPMDLLSRADNQMYAIKKLNKKQREIGEKLGVA